LFTARNLRWRFVEPGLYREYRGGPNALSLVFAFLVFALMFVGWNKKAARKEEGEEEITIRQP